MLLESILESESAVALGSARYSLDSYVNNMVKTDSYIFIGLAVFSVGLMAYAMYKYHRFINDNNRYRYWKK
ncbi:MAG: hypothetical protein ACP5RE_00470 [Candidatus Acidifodinimicrobium sp.]